MGDPASLDEAVLLAEARERTGFHAFGDESFREPLDVLLRSLRDEAGLHEVGRATQHARIVESLATRLSAEDHLRRHPEILSEDLGAPLVIVGLARTGTTMLHRLLASSGDFQAARWWEVRYPAPFPGSDWRHDDPRIAAAHAEVAATLEAVPVLASIHPWDAEGADEEIMLLEHSFLSWVPESGANVPGYSGWLTDQDLTPAYRYLARLLRFVQWQKRESGRGGGRWILKAPFHLAYLDVLLRVFPGARVIQTHRDPLETIPSTASFYRALWELNTDAVDSRRVGALVERRYAWALDRSMASRERHPPECFLDLAYRDVQSDPMAAVRRIYAWLGWPLSSEASEAMQAWLTANSRDRRPPHHYRLEDYGYTEPGLARTFGAYRDRFVA